MSHDPADALGILVEVLHRTPAEQHSRVEAALRTAVAGGATLADLLHLWEDTEALVNDVMSDLIRRRLS